MKCFCTYAHTNEILLHIRTHKWNTFARVHTHTNEMLLHMRAPPHPPHPPGYLFVLRVRSSSASSALFLLVQLFFSRSRLFFCICRAVSFPSSSSISALSFSSSFSNRLKDKKRQTHMYRDTYSVHRYTVNPLDSALWVGHTPCTGGYKIKWG